MMFNLSAKFEDRTPTRSWVMSHKVLLHSIDIAFYKHWAWHMHIQKIIPTYMESPTLNCLLGLQKSTENVAKSLKFCTLVEKRGRRTNGGV